jgi:hypothetical protein
MQELNGPGKIGGDVFPEDFVVYVQLFGHKLAGAFIIPAVAGKMASLAPAVTIVIYAVNESLFH